MELHGGSIRAASDGDGKGARFTVCLPTSTAVPVSAPLTASNVAGRQLAPSASLARVRVLVVEDELDTREFLARLLETLGAVVFTAASVAEALAVFPTAKPDVLISDIGLPDVDGYQLMEQVRARSVADGRSVPAIALTAYARPNDRAQALNAGYQAHLAKPVEPNDLVATIVKLAGPIHRQSRTS